MQTYNVSRLPNIIRIGWDGENLWRPQAFDCSVLLANHPSGNITLWLLPQGETDAFPVALERDGNTAVWTPTSAELVVKTGQLQLMCVDGVAVGKSAVVYYQRADSLVSGEASDTPSWAVQVVEDVTEAASHYPQIIDDYWWVWDVDDGIWVNTGVKASSEDLDPEAISDAVEDYFDDHPIEYPVSSVNGQTGVVELDAEDVGAYEKPSGGIPKTDLASAVQTSLSKADTAVSFSETQTLDGTQQWRARRNIGAAATTDIPTKTSDLTNDSGFQTAPFEIPITQSGSTYTTTASAADILANADNCVAVIGGVARVSADFVGVDGTIALLSFSYIDVENPVAPTEVYAVLVQNGNVTVAHASVPLRELPTVSSSDNGKFLRVVSGAWAVATVPAAESNSFGGGS